METPKLRSVEKYSPPYRLNEFPRDFAVNLGKEIVYLLATRETPRLEGADWEEIFARLIGAQWKPSNVGLDDIVLGQTAWGAKSVKNASPSRASRIRLISGRNSPVYSFGDKNVSQRDSSELGCKILSIWNERVSAVRKLYKHLRTVVLVKSSDLLELAIFEFETVLCREDLYSWRWNRQNNLEGFCKATGDHRFTWQPHGSQFTIIEDVPGNRLAIRIKQPEVVSRGGVLEALGFDSSWIEILGDR